MTADRLGFLIGTWLGEGRGEYPTIDDFTYTEEVTIEAVPGKPFLTYRQRTKGDDGQPLHAEVGYFRSPADGLAELVIAQPTGIAEIQTGRIEGTTVDLTSLTVALTPTAKDVRSISRRIAVDGDVLSYRLDMAAVGHPEQFHLEASLARVDGR